MQLLPSIKEGAYIAEQRIWDDTNSGKEPTYQSNYELVLDSTETTTQLS